MEAESFAEHLKTPGGITNVAQALATSMPPGPAADILPLLAEALLNSEKTFPDVSQSGPLAAEYARNLLLLRDLVDWNQHRLRPQQARRQISSPAAHDGLLNILPITDWSPAILFTQAALSLIRPTKRAAVVVTMRDDGISILEWIAHYRAIGFEGVFVYSNDNMDGSDALLRHLADHGIITFIENNTSGMISPQRKAFEHSLHFLPELRDYEWVFYANSDEFLVPGEEFDYNIQTVISMIGAKYPFRGPSAVCYHWRWFVSNYEFARTGKILLERFEHANSSKLLKSLVESRMYRSMRRLHFPDVSNANYFVDSNLDVITASLDPDMEGVWKFSGNGYRGGQLNHYWCKSFEEFLIKKRKRGSIEDE